MSQGGNRLPMPRNEHLLDNFLASKHTRTLGSHILRLVQAKTGPGSGRELGELKGGLPAAAILIACEQLNTTEVTTNSAQIASCLKPKDFKKVYDIFRVILEENDRASSIHCKPQSYFRKNTVSPSKSTTPRQSPRKVSAKRGSSGTSRLPGIQAESPQESPLRRSSRTAMSVYGSNASPTKPALPLPWKKGPKRELPSKDSPKKSRQSTNDQDTVIPDELLHTPSKRRKLESPSKTTDPGSSPVLPDQEKSGSSKSVPGYSPTKEHLSTPSSKRRHVTIDVVSSSDDSDAEEPAPRSRFRPVYLEHRQWVAADPRLALMWKKADKFKSSSIKRHVGSKSKG